MEILAIYSENYGKWINTLCEKTGFLEVKAGGACSSHWALER
jgi:hypothetical protein